MRSFSFVNYFLLISPFLFGNIKKLTFKTGTFVETTNTVYLRMHYCSSRFTHLVRTGTWHAFLLSLKSVSSAIDAF